MNIKVLLIIILLSIYVNRSNIEKFNELLVSSKEIESLNIDIPISTINELYSLLEFIKLGTNKPKIINDLPKELQNENVYNNILYEMYIDNFLDNYLVNRFNVNKYLKMNYNYTKNYDKLYSTIETLKTNRNNLNKFIFLQNSNNEIINLNNKIKKIEINEFKNFFKNDIKNYLDKVFLNLGLNEYFKYSLQELNNDNIVDIMDTLNLVIENEFNLFNNYIKK